MNENKQASTTQQPLAFSQKPKTHPNSPPFSLFPSNNDIAAVGCWPK
jgi:hypothetical protein